MTIDPKIRNYAITVVISMVVGAALFSDTTTIEKEVIKEVPTTQIVEVEKNQDTWNELKITDDVGFMLAGEGMQSCSRAFTAVANSDLVAMENEMEKLGEVSKSITVTATKRQELLTKLGY